MPNREGCKAPAAECHSCARILLRRWQYLVQCALSTNISRVVNLHVQEDIRQRRGVAAQELATQPCTLISILGEVLRNDLPEATAVVVACSGRCIE